MDNFASNIKIENFKSIRSLEMNDCKRINLFIGRPNVGKSNILEAFSLFSLPYYYNNNDNPNLKDVIRIKQSSELFFDGNTNEDIKVKVDNTDYVSVSYKLEYISIKEEDYPIPLEHGGFHFNFNLDLTAPDYIDFTESYHLYKSYYFPKKFKLDKPYFKYLNPYFGENLFDVIQNNQQLKQEILQLFKEYGLHLVFDKSSQELKIMKGVEKGEIFLIPFNSIADSLQRLIFYKTAIASNRDSIITFEEPEAHTYPPYISTIAQDIIASKTNQFFITTHSPYVVNEFLENAQDELAIYLVDFKDGQTVAKKLSDEQMNEVYNDGIDLFFNNELFL